MRSFILATAGVAALALASPAMAQHAGHSGGQWHGGGGQWHGGGVSTGHSVSNSQSFANSNSNSQSFSNSQSYSTGGGFSNSNVHWNGSTSNQSHGGNGSQWHGGHGGQWHGGGNHWGGKIGGRWIGGSRAPGGWGGYRHPVRGWSLPSYWIAPSFYISDWGDYGLSQPPYGYTWSRYYDDAVLVDQYGRVMDSVSGLDWDGGDDDGYADRGDYDYDYDHDVGPGAGYPPPPGGPGGYGYDGYDGPPPRVVVHQGPGCNCGGTVVNGWYYPGATTTTVTVTSVPVTTTTTEYIEEAAPVVIHRRSVHKWHAAPKRTWKHQTKVSHKVRCLC